MTLGTAGALVCVTAVPLWSSEYGAGLLAACAGAGVEKHMLSLDLHFNIPGVRLGTEGVLFGFLEVEPHVGDKVHGARIAKVVLNAFLAAEHARRVEGFQVNQKLLRDFRPWGALWLLRGAQTGQNIQWVYGHL